MNFSRPCSRPCSKNNSQTLFFSIVPGKEVIPDTLAPQCSLDSGSSKQASRTSSFEIENLLKTAEQVTGICRSPGETRKSISPTGSVLSAQSQVLTPSRQLTDAEKLKKVILELVETERTYVTVSQSLFEVKKILEQINLPSFNIFGGVSLIFFPNNWSIVGPLKRSI